MESHMRYCTAMLLAPTPDSSWVWYCRYPSLVCGPSNLNPSQARFVRDLTSLEIHRGSRAGLGALVGTSLDNWEAVPR